MDGHLYTNNQLIRSHKIRPDNHIVWEEYENKKLEFKKIGNYQYFAEDIPSLSYFCKKSINQNKINYSYIKCKNIKNFLNDKLIFY